MNLELDQDGHLVDYTIWNPEVAQELAKSLDLELTDWHFEVLAAVRQFYQQFGHSPATRPLIKFLMKTVSPDINMLFYSKNLIPFSCSPSQSLGRYS